ncbi:MAG TPA: C1 family peptidase [Candidatus Acidoferrales bacterium]|nr:C1 family peptidase [Candidatus Acidoferrales bacterium]
MPSKYAKGHVRRPDKDQLIRLMYSRHSAMLEAKLTIPPPPEWDSRDHKWVGKVKNQEQCGSCWDFSGTGIVEVAYNKAGIGGGPNTFILSEEYTLSCYRNGGCNGDDNTTVLEYAKAHGLPLKSDYTTPYGPFPNANTCKIPACTWKPTMKLHKITDWGFADGSSGSETVASTAAIKSAIMNYGAVGAGIAADDAFQMIKGGAVFQGSGATQIDHDIILIGWDDSKGAKGAWLLRNSWGTVWADKGYCWIAYGANRVGTEAVWCEVSSVVS